MARLMRRHQLQTKSKRPFRSRTTQSQPLYGVAPNRLQEQAALTTVNQTWGADITYVSTAVGWIYLTGILDLYRRKIVG